MSFPHVLNNLTTREAIADAIYRAVAAWDEYDIDLLASALTPDVIMEMQPGPTMTGFDAVKAHNFGRKSPMITSHFVTNLRVDVKDDDATTASVTCNVLAQHYPPGKGSDPEDNRRLLGGTKYVMNLVRDDDDNNSQKVWKIKKWVLKVVWIEGDLTVISNY